MVPAQEQLEACFKLGSTVPGMRNCHHFEPVSTSSLQAKHLSFELMYSVFHLFSISPENEHDQMISSLKPID